MGEKPTAADEAAAGGGIAANEERSAGAGSGIAIDEEGVQKASGGRGDKGEPAALDAVKSSKSNSSEGAPDTGENPDESSRATNLNSSKSNTPDESARATNLNTSRSNVYRTGDPEGGGDAGIAVSDPGVPGDKGGTTKG